MGKMNRVVVELEELITEVANTIIDCDMGSKKEISYIKEVYENYEHNDLISLKNFAMQVLMKVHELLNDF